MAVSPPCRRMLVPQQGPSTVVGCCLLAEEGWVAGLSPLQGVPSLLTSKASLSSHS